MPEGSFGDRLTAARLRKGLSIEQVSEVLRIRPSIIDALESCSFPHMPLKGYSRNMVSSYARFLGLNSTELTEQFLREYHEYEKRAARDKGENSAVDSSSRRVPNVLPPAHSAPEGRASAANERANVAGERETVYLAGRNTGSRSYWASEHPSTLNRTADPRRPPNSRGSIDSRGPIPASRQHRSGRSGRPSRADRSARQNKQGKQNNRNNQNDKTRLVSIRNKSYSSRKTRKGILSRYPFLSILVLVVVLLVILVGWALIANRCAQGAGGTTSTGAVANSPTTGVESSSINASTSDVQGQIDEDSKYGPFELRVEVTGTSWVAIVVDGKRVVDATVDPPSDNTYTVTSTATIEAGRPANVKVYRNGTIVEFDSSSGTGKIELKVEEKPIVPNAQQ